MVYQCVFIFTAILFSNCYLFSGQTATSQRLTAAAPGTPAARITSYNSTVVATPPVALLLDTFYRKYTDAWGIPIVSSGKVPDDALLIARDIVNYMLIKRWDVRETLIRQKARVLIMAQTEMETDLLLMV